jgi:transposase InsO family protein
VLDTSRVATDTIDYVATDPSGLTATSTRTIIIAGSIPPSAAAAPAFLRSDNGPEFVSKALLSWIVGHGIGSALIDPGKPWQNGVTESFNGKFRDECLSLEWFRSRAEALRARLRQLRGSVSVRITVRSSLIAVTKWRESWSEWQDLNLRPPRPERGAPSSAALQFAASERISLQSEVSHTGGPGGRLYPIGTQPRQV